MSDTLTALPLCLSRSMKRQISNSPILCFSHWLWCLPSLFGPLIRMLVTHVWSQVFFVGECKIKIWYVMDLFLPRNYIFLSFSKCTFRNRRKIICKKYFKGFVLMVPLGSLDQSCNLEQLQLHNISNLTYLAVWVCTILQSQITAMIQYFKVLLHWFSCSWKRENVIITRFNNNVKIPFSLILCTTNRNCGHKT